MFREISHRDAAAQVLANAADTMDDLEGSAEYKRRLIAVFRRLSTTPRRFLFQLVREFLEQFPRSLFLKYFESKWSNAADQIELITIEGI